MMCFIHRWRIAGAIDAGRELPEPTERHLAGCAACRAEWETGKTLAGRLTVAAREDRGSVPEGLHGRVMAAVRDEAPAHWGSTLAWRIWAPIGSVAVCLALAAGMFAFFAGTNSKSVVVVQQGGAADSSPLTQVSGLAPAVVSIASTAGQVVADPFTPEWAAIEKMASSATRTVLAAALERLPGGN